MSDGNVEWVDMKESGNDVLAISKRVAKLPDQISSRIRVILVREHSAHKFGLGSLINSLSWKYPMSLRVFLVMDSNVRGHR